MHGHIPWETAREEPGFPGPDLFSGQSNDLVGVLLGDVDSQSDDFGSRDAPGAKHVYSNGVLGVINHLLELLSEVEQLVGVDGSFEDTFLDVGEEFTEGVHDAVSSSVADDVVADDDVGHACGSLCSAPGEGEVVVLLLDGLGQEVGLCLEDVPDGQSFLLRWVEERGA